MICCEWNWICTSTRGGNAHHVPITFPSPSHHVPITFPSPRWERDGNVMRLVRDGNVMGLVRDGMVMGWWWEPDWNVMGTWWALPPRDRLWSCSNSNLSRSLHRMCSKIQRILTGFDYLSPNDIYLIESLYTTFERYSSNEKYLYLYEGRHIQHPICWAVGVGISAWDSYPTL